MTRPPNSPTLPALLLDGVRAAGGVAVVRAWLLTTAGLFSLGSLLRQGDDGLADLGDDE